MPKKVAFFLHELNAGGAQSVLVTLANAMAEEGVDVDFVLVRMKGCYLPMVSDKVTIIDLSVSKTIFAIPNLIRYAVCNKPDILVSALPHNNIIAIISIGLLKLFGNKIRLAITEHSIPSEAAKLAKDFSLKASLYLQSIFYPFADKIIAVSCAAATDLRSKLSSSKVEVIHNPIFDKKLLNASKEKVFHKWFEKNGSKLIVCVGRLHESKDYPTLFKALQKALCTENINLIVIGEGPEKASLEQLCTTLDIQNNVEFIGYKENPYPYMRQASLLVSSSQTESFGNVIVEAMAFGTPVVATATEGAKEIILNNKYGILVPISDVDALANAMVRMLEHPTDKKILLQRAKEFSVKKAVEHYRSILCL